MKIKKIWTMAALLGLAFAITALLLASSAAVIASSPFYVDAVHGSDLTGDGSQTNPWQTITYALSQVSAGDSIMVLPGTYDSVLGEVFPINIPPGISLIGSDRDTTLISGQAGSSVVYLGSNVTDIYSNTRIIHITLQNGNVGLELYASQERTVEPAISDVRVRWNDTGIKLTTGNVYENGATISPVITNTQVISNTGDGIYMRSYGYFSLSAVMPTIANSLIQDNGGNGISIEASAVSANGTHASPHIVGTTITGNTGHGLSSQGTYQGWAKPVVERSYIQNNGGYGVYWDEGINGGAVDASLINTVITGNQGGGVYIGQRSYYTPVSYLKIINSTLADNKNYGVYWKRQPNFEVSPLIRNTILWNTAADDLYASGDPWTVDQVGYSIIEDGDLDGLNGNFRAEPRLLEDYHLDVCSPAVDTGTSTGAPDEDIDGDPRPLGAAYDIGADEAKTPCWLKVTKQSSAELAEIGDTLAYTITLQNTTLITPLNVLLTDTIPQAIQYKPGSLWASQGMPTYDSGTISWLDTIAPGAMVTVGLQTKVIRGGTTIDNIAYVDTGVYGITRSPACRTVIDLWNVSLPTIFQNYCTDFFDDFSNPNSGWFVGEDDRLRAEYINGEYRVLVKPTEFLFVFRAPTCDRQNYVVEADARWAGNSGASYGLIFGVKGNFEQLYTFEVNTDYREFALFRYGTDGWHLLYTAGSLAIHSGTATNHLKVTRNASAITLDINGTTLVTWYDAAIIGDTGTGLLASSYEDLPNADARFDNFQVTRLPGAATVTSTEAHDAMVAPAIQPLENMQQLPLLLRQPWREAIHH